MRILKNNRGFSLIEIIVAIALVALVGATIFANVGPKQRKGKVNLAKIAIRNLEGALETFYIDCNFYPSSAEGLEALVSAPDRCESWGPEPYLKNGKIPKDPWKNDFIYRESDSGGFEIISLGSDGKEGGKDYAQDISSKDL